MLSKKKHLSYLQSLIKLRCPKCREGSLFIKEGLFIYSDMLGMDENCSVCGQKYEIEPGFWIGAMWISYPIVVAIELPFLFLALFADGWHTWAYFGGMVVAFLTLWPFMLRVGRSAWIHISIHYDENSNKIT